MMPAAKYWIHVVASWDDWQEVMGMMRKGVVE